MTVFEAPRQGARSAVMRVHHKGRATTSEGPREAIRRIILP